MAIETKSAIKTSGKPTAPTKANLAKLLKRQKKLELDLKDAKQDIKRLMLWIHHACPFVQRKRKRK
jgi:hypothetical protein